MRDHAEHQANVRTPGNFVCAQFVCFVVDATLLPDGIQQNDSYYVVAGAVPDNASVVDLHFSHGVLAGYFRTQ